jgi:hypothetical protein
LFPSCRPANWIRTQIVFVRSQNRLPVERSVGCPQAARRPDAGQRVYGTNTGPPRDCTLSRTALSYAISGHFKAGATRACFRHALHPVAPGSQKKRIAPSKPEIRRKPIYVKVLGLGTRSRTENLEASRGARCFCVAAERCVVTCGISTTPGLSVGLSPASGVVRCILVTVENKWGEAAQIDCIAAQEMYRSNRGCQLSAWVQGGA